MTKWVRRHMELACHVAAWSQDPSTKVGAVIARPDKTIASVGYNGFPRGVKDTPERYADRDFKLAAVVHAETNAILNAREPLHAFTMFCTFHPCARCAAFIVQAGLSCVVIDDTKPIPERWQADMAVASTILEEGGVKALSYSNLSQLA